MPKEQPCVSKRSPCAASSKNAKEKSNNTTLQAMRDAADAVGSGGRGSSCSSEKDSGYSDGSDWLQTDAEDRQSSKPRGSGRAGTSRTGQNEELEPENPGNLTSMPAGPQPVYIINNTALKEQPDMIQKRGQLPRRNVTRETGGPAHVILLQQPSVFLATLQLHMRRSSSRKTVDNTYLPILNSYPRIAPHPGKKPPDESQTSNDGSQNLSKRVCTERKSGATPEPEQHLRKQPEAAASSSEGSPSGSGLSTASSSSSSPLPTRNGSTSTSTRHRRFLNTAEILRQSGLLDITLRTKELQRQSNATELDIAQLRQHTELLCQAASNPTAWERLQRSMAESGSYPDSKTLQNLQIQSQAVSASEAESFEYNSVVPTSPFLTSAPKQNCPVPPQSHSGQDRVLEAGCRSAERAPFMVPDSSTG